MRIVTGRKYFRSLGIAACCALLLLGAVTGNLSPDAKAQAADPSVVAERKGTRSGTLTAAAKVSTAYREENLPQFRKTLPQLSQVQQERWLVRLYDDGAVPYFGSVIGISDISENAAADLAEKAYVDGSAAFFSMTLQRLTNDQLEKWYERAEADRNLAFLSILADALDWEEKWDAAEEELARQQTDEYMAAGIEMGEDGWLYNGRRIRILYDSRLDSSCYLLSIEPEGTISICVERNGEGKIRKIRVMSSDEEREILSELNE